MKNDNKSTADRRNLYKAKGTKNRLFCIQKELGNYFESAGGQSPFDFISGAYGRIEVYSTLGVGSVLDGAVVDVMPQAVIIVAVNICKDRADDGFHIGLGRVGGILAYGDLVSGCSWGYRKDYAGVTAVFIEMVYVHIICICVQYH